LKLPTSFRGLVREQEGPEIFVTSLTGESVLVYPMQVWLQVEQTVGDKKLHSHPSLSKFVKRTNFYGSHGELDSQGRFLIPALLRERAAIVGEVFVLGRLNHIEVWNAEKLNEKIDSEQWTDADGLALSEFGI
jgi:division/cell wall cluster transcriptional repressor MraZ